MRFQVAGKCLDAMSSNPVSYVARKFIDYFWDMIPQDIFSTVCAGRENVQLVVTSGLNFIELMVVSKQGVKVFRQGLVCKFVEKIHTLNVKYSI